MPQRRAVATKTKPCIRWIVLLIVSVSSFSYYFAYDIPLSLQRAFTEHYELSALQYNLLYSVYAYPNVILAFINGLMADTIGFHAILALSFCIIIVGQFLIWCSLSWLTSSNHAYIVLLTGRTLFGIGSESFLLLITPIIYAYFKHKELSFSLALYFIVSRSGTAVTLLLAHYSRSLQSAIDTSMYILCGCVLSVFALIVHRVRQNKHMLRAHTDASLISADVWNVHESTDHIQPRIAGHIHHNDRELEHEINSKMELLQSSHAQITYHTNSQHTANLNLLPTPPNNAGQFAYPQQEEVAMGDDVLSMFSSHMQTTYMLQSDIILLGINKENKFRVADMRQFDIRYWLLIINGCLLSAAIVPFLVIGSDYMQTLYPSQIGGAHNGNLLLMIPVVFCAVGSPILSVFIEKYGGRCQWLLLAAIVLSISHYILGNGDSLQEVYYPIIALVGIGLAYSAFTAVIWPSFALVVTAHLLPTAYCIQMAVYNANIGSVYLVVGVLMDGKQTESEHDYNYKHVNLLFTFLSLLSILTVILLWYFDEQHLKKSRQQIADATPLRNNHIPLRHDANTSELLMAAYNQ